MLAVSLKIALGIDKETASILLAIFKETASSLLSCICFQIQKKMDAESYSDTDLDSMKMSISFCICVDVPFIQKHCNLLGFLRVFISERIVASR